MYNTLISFKGHSWTNTQVATLTATAGVEIGVLSETIIGNVSLISLSQGIKRCIVMESCFCRFNRIDTVFCC